MRKWYLLPLVLIVGDLAVFWVLKQFGVLRLGHIPLNWVKTAFLLPLDIAWMAGLFAVIRGAVQGVAYSSLGGSEIKCSNEPLRFVFNVMAHSLVFGFGIVAFTWLMFVHAD